MTEYRAKQNVKAVQWREDNLDQVKALLKGVVDGDDEGPFVYATEIEPYYLTSLGHRPGYLLLQFYANDDMEVDPGQWIVVYDTGDVEIMSDEQFNFLFEEAN